MSNEVIGTLAIIARPWSFDPSNTKHDKLAIAKVAPLEVQVGTAWGYVNHGHAFLARFGNDGKLMETFGTWGGIGFKRNHKRDVEMARDPKAFGCSVRRVPITVRQEKELLLVLKKTKEMGPSAWDLYKHPCTAFAAAGWLAATGERIEQIGLTKKYRSPTQMAKSIREHNRTAERERQHSRDRTHERER